MPRAEPKALASITEKEEEEEESLAQFEEETVRRRHQAQIIVSSRHLQQRIRVKGATTPKKKTARSEGQERHQQSSTGQQRSH